MTQPNATPITVSARIKAPVSKVWDLWTRPEHIVRWNQASADWHTPRAINDLQEGGTFSYRMESKDGSMGFDFTGTYEKVEQHKEIRYTIEDGRNVTILFTADEKETTVTESFEAEGTHPADLQRDGWQAILDNFKQYAEAQGDWKKAQFSMWIEAPAATVYTKMLDDQGYREWTAPFNPTSFFRGSWEKGSTIHFIGLDKDGNEEGMVGRIEENIPARFVSIRHLGLLKNGQEITSGPEVESWAGVLENYTLTEEDNRTLVAVETDVDEQWMGYMSEKWPKALQKLKEISEG